VTTTTDEPAPMSDFLDREEDVLGGEFTSSAPGPGLSSGFNGTTDIDLNAAAAAFPDISLDGSGDIPLPAVSAPSQPAQGAFSFDAFSPRPVHDVKVTGDDELDKFEEQFPDLDDGSNAFSPPPSLPQQPSFGALPPFAPRPQPSTFTSTPILQQSLQDEEEPTAIKEWREKQAADIKKRDEASKARREETIAKAEKAIDVFYGEYNEKKARNIKENKVQEAEYLATLSDAISKGTTWDRICRHIDLENSQSKTLARTGAGTTDLGRFKEVLLRLKREGESAPGAGGY